MSSMKRPPLTSESAWKKLQNFYDQYGKEIKMTEMFSSDANRFEKFSVTLKGQNGDFLLDYSKNLVNDDVMKLLFDLARERKVEEVRTALYTGEQTNLTEKKEVLTAAFRNRSNTPMMVNGKDVMPDVNRVLQHMREFCASVLSGQWKGFTGMPITDVVNIGIGGPNVGPLMATEALEPYQLGPNVHFVSTVDGTHLAKTLKRLNPETTLFVIASMTFTTLETLTNANSAKSWFLEATEGDVKGLAKHFVAVSKDLALVKGFGIIEENWFECFDCSGFSLWSDYGLSVALFVGMDNFEDMLNGGYFMDQHFLTAPLEKNIPVILALLGVWYINFHCAETHAILPYDQSMHRFPAYVQMIDTERKGKSVTRSGQPVNYKTGGIVWGEAGTNGQHSFFQLFHQGTRLLPCDFILPVETHNPIQSGLHHEILTANYLAQTEALMKGKTVDVARADLVAAKMSPEDIELILTHNVFEGNRPSNSFLVQKVTPFTLGAFLAMYEMKVFIQAVIWDINSFAQYGVRLGKNVFKVIQPELSGKDPVNTHDSSTNGLINFIKSHKP